MKQALVVSMGVLFLDRHSSVGLQMSENGRHDLAVGLACAVQIFSLFVGYV